MPLTWLIHFISAPGRWWEVTGVGMGAPTPGGDAHTHSKWPCQPLRGRTYLYGSRKIFSVWCLSANDPTRPQCPWLSSDTRANHLQPLHRHVCQDPTLRRISSLAGPGQRSPVLQRPRGGSRETACSLFPDNLGGNGCARKHITCPWEKIWKDVKDFFFTHP